MPKRFTGLQSYTGLAPPYFSTKGKYGNLAWVRPVLCGTGFNTSGLKRGQNQKSVEIAIIYILFSYTCTEVSTSLLVKAHLVQRMVRSYSKQRASQTSNPCPNILTKLRKGRFGASVVKTEISLHFYRLEIKSCPHSYRQKIKPLFLQTERN